MNNQNGKNINKDVINKIIEERPKYIPYFETKYKKMCKTNNIIFVDLNKLLKKIVDENCIYLIGDIKGGHEMDHHYIFEILTLCFLTVVQKYVKINKKVINNVYNDYKTYIQYKINSQKGKKKGKGKKINKKICNYEIVE